MSDTNPTLVDVVKDPALLRAQSVQVLAGLLVELAALQQCFAAALLASPGAASAEPLQLLTVCEAAARLGLHPKTLYRRAKTPPFNALVVPVGVRALRFSSTRLSAYLAQRAEQTIQGGAVSLAPRVGRGPHARFR